MMDINYIKSEIALISKISDSEDDENAHMAEDALHINFIKYIAEHAPADLAEMAREVLKTADIDFYRWYA